MVEALFCFRDEDNGEEAEEWFPFLPFSSSLQPARTTGKDSIPNFVFLSTSAADYSPLDGR